MKQHDCADWEAKGSPPCDHPNLVKEYWHSDTGESDTCGQSFFNGSNTTNAAPAPPPPSGSERERGRSRVGHSSSSGGGRAGGSRNGHGDNQNGGGSAGSGVGLVMGPPVLIGF
jgi:hypothetical protein